MFLALGSEEGARYVYKDNKKHKIIDIHKKEYQCSECNMDIEDMRYEAQIITKNGNTYFFDDIGCIILWLKNHDVQIVKIVTKTIDTNKWLNVNEAWYSKIAQSPMGYGFGAYELKEENFVNYEEMKILMLQGKNLHDPFIRKKLLGI
jgi:hypothetical protein